MTSIDSNENVIAGLGEAQQRGGDRCGPGGSKPGARPAFEMRDGPFQRLRRRGAAPSIDVALVALLEALDAPSAA